MCAEPLSPRFQAEFLASYLLWWKKGQGFFAPHASLDDVGLRGGKARLGGFS